MASKIKLFCRNVCPKSCDCKKKTTDINDLDTINGSTVSLNQQQVLNGSKAPLNQQQVLNGSKAPSNQHQVLNGSKAPSNQQQVFTSCLNQFGIAFFNKLSNYKGIHFLEILFLEKDS